MTPDSLFSIPSLIDQVHSWAVIWMPNLLPWFAFFLGITLVFIVARGIYEFFSDHIGGFADTESEFSLYIPKANFLTGPQANLPFDHTSLMSGNRSNDRSFRKDVYYHGFHPKTHFYYTHSYVGNFQKNQGKQSGNDIVETQYPTWKAEDHQ